VNGAPGTRGRGHVADGHRDCAGIGFGPQLRGHVRRQLQAVHGDPAGAQRQRHPPGADGELQRGTTPGQPGQQVDDRVEHDGSNLAR
jgi:hypothetical protein